MTTIAQARQALAAAVTTGTGLRCERYQLDVINAPEACIVRREMSPGIVFDAGPEEFHFAVRVFAGRSADRQSQVLLDTYCEISGATSVKAAVETSANWGAISLDYARVTRIGEPFIFAQVPEVGPFFFAVDIDVEVVF